MCDYDSDSPAAYWPRWRRARKEHLCCACAEQIKRGELYHYTSGIWDEPDQFKHCARCWKMLCDLVELTASNVQLDLDCGEPFEASEDDPMHALAFMTRTEGQAYAAQAATVPSPPLSKWEMS